MKELGNGLWPVQRLPTYWLHCASSWVPLQRLWVASPEALGAFASFERLLCTAPFIRLKRRQPRSHSVFGTPPGRQAPGGTMSTVRAIPGRPAMFAAQNTCTTKKTELTVGWLETRPSCCR